MGYRRAGLGIMNVSSKNNDIMSSYENKSGTNARWYHDADGKGRCVTMLAYRSVSYTHLTLPTNREV